MKKYILVTVLILICALALCACSNKGIEEEPLPAQTIEITSAEELAAINNYTGKKYMNYTFSLKNDIDLSSNKQWKPIGNKENPFMGKFEGNNFTINNFIYIGIDEKGEPTVNEECNIVGLFGYTRNASISNFKLENINIKCYSKGEYFHTAGLVAYNIGESLFSGITISGNISLSNIYTYDTTYGMDGKIQDDHLVKCNTTQYAGGFIGYSSGNTTFSDINVNVNITNNNYRAVYDKVYNEVDGEKVLESEGYYIHTYSNASYLPAQTLAGLFGGLIKNGASIQNISSNGNMTIFAKSVYSCGGIAILIDSTISDANFNECAIISKASEKIGASGAVALLDNSKANNLSVKNLTLTAEPIADSIKNISIGGLLSYCYDRAELSISSVNDFTVTTTEKQKLQLGGIVGVIRDANVLNSNAKGSFIIEDRKVSASDYLNSAAIVYAIYGNSLVSNNTADIDNTLLTNGQISLIKNSIEYGTTNNISYVNEDGKKVTRFAHPNDIKNYVEIFVMHEKTNEIKTFYYNDEGEELGSLIFSVNDNEFVSLEDNCLKYLVVYYSENLGLLNNDGTALSLDGKSFAGYKHITGIPVLSNNVVLL